MRHALGGLLALIVMATLAGPVLAQDGDSRVLVPDVPGGATVSGCFRANRDLYGENRLTLCLRERGSYGVEGHQINCTGGLAWSVEGPGIFVRLDSSPCGRGQSWAAATLACRPETLSGPRPGRIPDPRHPWRWLDVPDDRRVAVLRCTYRPSVPGQPRQTFTANRI